MSAMDDAILDRAIRERREAIEERDRLRMQLDRLAEAVRAISPAEDTCVCEHDRDITHDEPDGCGPIYVRRAVVLALLEPAP